MILTCSSIRLTTHLIRIILTHALTFYARFRALNLFLQKAHMSAGGKTLEVFSLPPPKFPNASDRLGSGGLVADGTHLFYAQSPGPDILKFALDGTIVGRISKRSSWFRSPRRDLPPDITPQFWKAFREWTATSTESIFELSDQTLMIQYFNGERGAGYQIFTKDGALVAEELGLKTVFLHGEYGLVYRPVQPALDGQGELPNPYVEVYQFVAR